MRGVSERCRHRDAPASIFSILAARQSRHDGAMGDSAAFLMQMLYAHNHDAPAVKERKILRKRSLSKGLMPS